MTADNPFSTRQIRPGAVRHLFPSGLSARVLVEQLQQQGWIGQVIGPHGCGKSSLLASLVPEIERAGRPVVLVELHNGQSALPSEVLRVPEFRPSGMLIIDGYEQLARWNRFVWRRRCRQQGVGLLITSHRSVGLPDLYRPRPTLALAQGIVVQLQRGRPTYVKPEDVEHHYALRHGNLREMLFDLYDLYQERQARRAAV